jgi:hypothetical protein
VIELTNSELGRRGFRSNSRAERHRYFLIGKQCTGHYSPTGRGTRGFVAFEVLSKDDPPKQGEDNRLNFLKDYWRPHTTRLKTELEVYAALETASVSHVPTLVGGGDVLDEARKRQQTESPKFDKRFSPRQHVRLVLKQVGRPLEQYANSWQLVYLLYHALRGMPLLE